jgi:serine protease Do
MIKTKISLLSVLLQLALPAIAQDAGWLGLSLGDQKERGVVIRTVALNGPAAKAGLKVGDIILQFNNQDVVGVRQLTRLVRETPVGRNVELKIQRDNQDQTIQVTTERAPNDLPGFGFQPPDLRGLGYRLLPEIQLGQLTYRQAGIRVDQMTDQLRDFFGVFSNFGVLVVAVERNSAADKAGLKAGDVVIAVNGKNIHTPADFSREMRAAGPRATLKIVRDKQELEIQLE